MSNKSPEIKTETPVTPDSRLLALLRTNQALAREKAREGTLTRKGHPERKARRSPRPQPLLRDIRP